MYCGVITFDQQNNTLDACLTRRGGSINLASDYLSIPLLVFFLVACRTSHVHCIDHRETHLHTCDRRQMWMYLCHGVDRVDTPLRICCHLRTGTGRHRCNYLGRTRPCMRNLNVPNDLIKRSGQVMINNGCDSCATTFVDKSYNLPERVGLHK